MNNAHKIAILCTGDEITNGDILNSNSQEIARRIFDIGMNIGLHATAPDDKYSITQTINFLLKDHDALIITGGLGPTSDDLTRYALGDAMQLPLEFYETCWENIRTRLAKLGYLTPPENNRQQALFPQGSIIIPNDHGTAAGCYLVKNGKIIFMLPGPPFECLPMLDTVINVLSTQNFYQALYRDHWFLFSTSEGQIASELDPLMQGHHSIFGYRICYPYLEVKLLSRDEKEFLYLKKLVEEKINRYCLGESKKFISELLKEKIIQSKHKIGICDHATGGALESLLKTPNTSPYLEFASDCICFKKDIPIIEVSGLEDYWNAKNSTETSLSCILKYKDQQIEKNQIIPFRGSRVKQYAVEWISYQILKFLPLLPA